MSNEQPVKDVDFDEPPVQRKRINYKEVFLQLTEGDNIVRFIDMKGKKIGTHWVKDTNGKQRSVKCPVEGCPCCKATPAVPTQYKTFMKVVDRLGAIRIFEFGSQIMNQLRRIIAELKEADPNALLTQRDIVVNKGPRGANPLYNVKLVAVNANPTPAEQLRTQAIEEAIQKDELDLSEIVVPWDVARINEYIYGIKPDGTVVEGATPADNSGDASFAYGANAPAGTPEASVAVASAPAPAQAPQAPAATAPKNAEDLSMFD
jgi:hypothetical protein